MKDIVWASKAQESTLETVGGKGANLSEMMSVGLPVPAAFMVTAGAYQRFVEEAGLADEIADVLENLDVDTNATLTEASERVQELILEQTLPKKLDAAIRDAYRELSGDEEAEVAIRSSATAEDLPEASFAGQQDTYLHVQGVDDVVQHVQRCWASLFTPRAIYYRTKNDFPHEQVHMAVVVQRMVDAEKAGVLFTRHPTTGETTRMIEAAWGLGEGVVSGQVSPDQYNVSEDGELLSSTIATKGTMFRGAEGGGVEHVKVPEDMRTERVLTDDEIQQLVRLASTLEKHYGDAQDVEWAFEDDALHILQTRPITTIQEPDDEAEVAPAATSAREEPILTGLGAAPGIGAGPTVRLETAKELDRCQEGDILVTTMTAPDMVPAMKRASAIVTDEGGMTCHAAIVSRELGIPCVVGTKNGTEVLGEGREVTVDGDKGNVIEGIEEAPEPQTRQAAAEQPETAVAKPVTATEVKVNVSMPEATERARATDADGVGLLRVEHIVLGLGEHPMRMIEDGRGEAFVDHLVDGIHTVADAFDPRPVWVRTLDAPTDEFRGMPGGDREPDEANPMLGFRGIRRGLVQTEILRHEFRAIHRLHEVGLTNVGVMLPLVQDPREIREAKAIAREEGLDPDATAFEFGIMIEIPASAILIDEMIDEGLDFVSFGTNDLTQYTLAVDRNNPNVAGLFDEFHPAVGRLIERTIEACRKRGVKTSICGQAGSDPRFATNLVEWGITSISANIDAVDRVRETVAREEQRMLLEATRRGRD